MAVPLMRTRGPQRPVPDSLVTQVQTCDVNRVRGTRVSQVRSTVGLTFQSCGCRYLAGRTATRFIDRVPQGKNGR